MSRKNRFIVAVFCYWLISVVAVATAQDIEPRQWKIGGDTREGLVVVPKSAQKSNEQSKPAPVVFAFHGHGGTMRHASQVFPIHKLWPEAICVYLQGLPTPGQLTDPEGKRAGWQRSVGDQGDRDLKLFDAVLESLHTETLVDDQRVFAMGHSNGGGFTYLLMAARGDKLAAIAPSAALSARPGAEFQPKPVLHIGAHNDPLVKFAWQESMINRVKKLNQCDAESKPWADGKCELFHSKIGAPVALLLHEGQHKYPADAPKIVVQFFKEFKQL